MVGYPSFIGFRYLRSRKKSSISAIGIIAIAGVALGVASLSVVISISSGFQDEFTDKVLGVNAHLLVMKYGLDFTEYREVMAKAKALPEVKGVAPFVIQEMMISKGEKSGGVLLKGIDPTRVGDVMDLPKHIVKGGIEGLRIPGSGPARMPMRETSLTAAMDPLLDNESGTDVAPVQENSDADAGTLAPEAGSEPPPVDPSKIPGIVIGRTLAENLGVGLGDVVQVTTPLIGLDVFGWEPTEDTPRTLPFRIVGLFYAGFLEYDTKLAYVDYYQAQRFFNHGDAVTGLELTLYERYQVKKIGRKIKKLLGEGPYHMVDWMMLNEHLFTALMIQKTALVMVLAVIVGVAAFNIIATLVMMVFDKRREIAILKSMGATRQGISRIFLHVGLFVGLTGISIGLVVGFGICYLLHEVGWPLDPGVYLVDHLPVRLQWIDFVMTAGIAFVICQLATVLPALSASKFNPVDGLRQD
jgi:lipoprotein-releasing system permease protein